MKKFLQPLVWLLVAGLALVSAPQAQATHILGGDLTYSFINTTPAGNVYRVKYRFYRDCSGTSADNWDLHYRNNLNCGSSTTNVRMTKVGNTVAGAPYCPGDPNNTCNQNSALPNYDLTTYQIDLTLAPGVWSFYIYEDDRSRPNIANLLNEDGTAFNCNGSKNEMFLEATLDNTGGVNNTSPQWDPQDLVVQYVGLNQRSTITYSATETDGDSLVYEMVQPYDRCGRPIPYAPYRGGSNTGGTVALPNGCTLTLPPAFTNYSVALPLPVALDTIGNCPNRRAVPSFYFNATARTVTFTPNYYNPAGTPNCGYNKYQLVMKISEYRRVNGVRRLMGTVVREGVIIVLNGTNHTPAAPVAGNQTPNSGVGTTNRPDSLEVRVVVGNYARVRLNFTDPDPSDLLKVTYSLPSAISDASAGPVPPGISTIGTFALVRDNTPNPVGTFNFQPSTGAIPPGATERVERINFRAEDNACPVKGVQNRVLVVRIVTRTYLAGIAAANPAGTLIGRSPAPGTPAGFVPPAGSIYQPVQTCGNNLGLLTLTGSITRPDSVRALGSNVLVRQQYAYQWSLLQGNGFPSGPSNTAILAVNPTITSRYRLTVTAQLGFFTPIVDTTSIVVRFLPPPAVTATASPAATCAAALVTLTGTATRADGLTDTYTYAWSGGNLPAGTTGQTITVSPTATTRYFLTVTGRTLVGCDAATSVEVQVLPPPTATATATPNVVCPGGTVTLTGTATRADGLPDTYIYTWTGGDLPTAGVTGPTVTAHPTADTQYSLTVTSSSRPGCAATATAAVSLPPAPSVSFRVDSAAANGSFASPRLPITYTLTNTSTIGGGLALDSVRWTYQRVRNGASQPVQEAETTFSRQLQRATIALNKGGEYVFRLYAGAVAGGAACAATAGKPYAVRVPTLDNPNVMTPNGDGLNDKFTVNNEYLGSKLQIYNRWGRKVEEFASYQGEWEAADQGPGIYYYVLTDAAGNTSKGWVEVLK